MTRNLKLHGMSKPDGGHGSHWVEMSCGHCGKDVSAAVIAVHQNTSNDPSSQAPEFVWTRCPSCFCGSVARGRVTEIHEVWPPGNQMPTIEGLPDDVLAAYDEASRCFGVSAFTACELVCRKILMHVAVDKGADVGKSFGSYVGFLKDEGYATPPMLPWVDKIREHGNEATHELVEIDQKRAEGTMMFTAELLRLVYEMEAMAKRFAPAAATIDSAAE